MVQTMDSGFYSDKQPIKFKKAGSSLFPFCNKRGEVINYFFQSFTVEKPLWVEFQLFTG